MSLKDQYQDGLSCYNAGDLDRLADHYAEDAVLVTPQGTFKGRAAIRQYWGWDKTACPDGKNTVRAVLEEGDTVATEFTYTGTNTGPIHLPDGTELPAGGKRVEMTAMDLMEMRDGKVAAHHVYWDNMEFARQLGLGPESATA